MWHTVLGWVNHDMRAFSLLLNDGYPLLNADLNNRQLTKCTHLTKMTILPQTERSKIKQAVSCYTSTVCKIFNKNTFNVFLFSIFMKMTEYYWSERILEQQFYIENRWSSELLCHVVFWQCANVSEKHTASIIRVEHIDPCNGDVLCFLCRNWIFKYCLDEPCASKG
jgi:hypothetical protein